METAKLTRTAVDRFGSVDLLVNNAGIFIAKAFTDSATDDFQRLVSTNLTGFFHVTQAAVRQMRAQGSGHVVTISTSLASQPINGVSAALSILTKGGLNAADEIVDAVLYLDKAGLVNGEVIHVDGGAHAGKW